jgi:hypothetical protein
MSKYSIWLVIIALLVGLFVGYAIERQRAIGKMEAAKLVFQNQINEVKASNEKMIMEIKRLQFSLTPTPTAETKKIIPSPLPTQE